MLLAEWHMPRSLATQVRAYMRNLLLGSIGLVALASAPASASPVLFNGHYYDIVLLPNDVRVT